MFVISSREFRNNQKKYMELTNSNQQAVIQRGKGKAYVLTPMGEKDRYFMDPGVMAEIQECIARYRAGKSNQVVEADINRLLGL